MAPKKPAPSKKSTPPAKNTVATPATAAGSQPLPPSGTRELVESLVIAFVLAFLFRTFEAEAFQIPTGSMGPTLMGRHKDVNCPQCGYAYQVGSSEEINQDTNQELEHQQVISTTCPICRYTMPVGPADPARATPSYKGDRIWVNKAIYEAESPERWDVAVFKYPEQGDINYIKRLVGLPGETIRIERGNLYVVGDDAAHIAQKPPRKLLTVMQPVDDSSYVVDRLLDAGFPPRWHAADGAAWQSADRGRTFVMDKPGSAGWVRYYHLVPTFEDWQSIDKGGRIAAIPKPQLIADFCAYNAAGHEWSENPAGGPSGVSLGLHWVGDLVLECELEIASGDGSATLELVEGGRRFQCRIDTKTGDATLALVGEPKWEKVFATAIHQPGRYQVRMANVDDQLVLWVDNELIAAESYAGVAIDNVIPTPADLEPVGISADGLALTVRDLRIFRDVYYVAYGLNELHRRMGPITDLTKLLVPGANDLPRREIVSIMSDPSLWPQLYADENCRTYAYDLADDEFLAMGDNSPNSSDSRFWQSGYGVKRDLLIGKAMFVYWPHAWPTPYAFRVRLGRFGDVDLPFYPNLSRMRMIR